MKQFYLLSTLLCALAISNPVSAQITIDEVKTDPSERILKNEVRPTTVDAQSYFSRARYRAERAAIRKERNTLEFGGGILGSVASYSDSWIETSGGDNSIGLAATLFLHHTFTKQRFTIETKFDAKFGYNRMNIEVAGDGGSTTSEATWYKNQDEFQISTNPAYIINKSWQVGSIIKFRSQFANGYVSRSQQTADDRKSTFYVAGLPRHIGRFHLHLSPRAFSDQDQPLADRPERRIRRKRQGPQQQMGRQTGLAGLRPFECEQNLEIRGRFLNPDRLRPDVRQKGHFPLPHHALLLHGLDVEFEHEKQIYQRQRLRKSSPGLG